MKLNIYSAPMQPAIRVYFGPQLGIKPFWSISKPGRLMWCWLVLGCPARLARKPRRRRATLTLDPPKKPKRKGAA